MKGNLLMTEQERIKEIHVAFNRWRNAGDELIEATLELGKQLYEARQLRANDQEFSAWLDRNELAEISHNDRAGFIRIGKNPDIARAIMTETGKRSPQHIGEQIKKRFPQVRKPKSRGSKSRSASMRKGNATKARKKQVEFSVNLLAEIRRRRKEAADVKINGKWRPEAVNKLKLHDLLGWIEDQLANFINNGVVSLETDTIKSNQSIAERVEQCLSEKPMLN